MKQLLFISIFLINCCIYSYSQTVRFNNVYDLYGTWDHANSVIVETDGYFVTGTTAGSSGPNRKLALMKIDLNGNLLWYKNHSIINANFWDQGHPDSFVKTDDTCYVFCGILQTSTGKDVVLIKFNHYGDTLWQKTFGDSTLDWSGYQCKETIDKGFIIVGTANATSTNTDLLLIKTDSLGNFQWKKTINYTQEIGESIICTNDGGFLIGGIKQSGAYNYGWIVKTDSLGNISWQTTLGGLYGSEILSVAKTLDGNYIASGFLSNTSNGSYDFNQGLVLKIASNGTVIWQKLYGRPSPATAFPSVDVLPDSSYILAGANGYDQFSGYDFSGFVVKIDANGDSLWGRVFDKYGTGTTDKFSKIKRTPDNGFIVAGDFFPNFQDMWVVKLDSMGCDTIGCISTGIVDMTIPNEGLLFFPNPFSTSITISSSRHLLKEISVYNLMGQLNYTKHNIYSNSSIIDLTLFEKGIYIIKIKLNNEKIYIQKIIKSN